ncbi:MAG TPA: sigma-54 dependent transcriptional regulator [Polyangiaceae bacterium]|nr:sigma-54 dependent transcriptional regulator [Polyangiaceae bacterium]
MTSSSAGDGGTQLQPAACRYRLVISAEACPKSLPANLTWLGPWDSEEELLASVQEWLVWAKLDLSEPLTARQLLGRAPAFCRLIARLRAAARFDAPVLLKGETGTGKEVAARAIHHWSARQRSPFVPVNCGGSNDDLFASELFGYEKGAFTDARERRPGLIAAAEGGTLFLDEINSLSPKSQAKLLRFMQDRSYRPLGARRSLEANVRIVAASNQPLDELVSQGVFREDLYYRLEVLSIGLPPLRERRQDIPLLAQHFLERLNARYGLTPKRLHGDALEWLVEQRWPGNVRELENHLHRLYALTDGLVIQQSTRQRSARPSSSSPCASDAPPAQGTAFKPFHDAKSAAIAQFERSYLEQLLEACQGNISLAARHAGKERRTFGRLVRKYGLNLGSDGAE